MQPYPKAPAAFLVTMAVVLAGCLGGSDPDADGGDAGDAPSLPGGRVPPGCDAARPAVAHRAGGVPVTAPSPRPIPCMTRTGLDSWEPTLGITARDVVFMSARDTNPGSVGAARSDDGGATWRFVEPSTGPAGTHPISLDPYLYVDPATSRVFIDDLLPAINCSVLSWSDDDGATWEHSAAGCMEFDHQTLFAGPPASSTTIGYPNVVYRCAINTVALAGLSTTSTCQRSLDGGISWLPPGEPAFVGVPQAAGQSGVGYCDGALGHGIVDPQGRVYLPKGLCGQPWLAWSDDEGLTWTRVQVADNGMNDEDGYPGHEAGIAVDATGVTYYAWVAADRLPYLVVSHDRGATWGEPMMVGVPGLVESSLPALVAGGAGRIALAYVGSTDSPGGPPWPSGPCGPDACLLIAPTTPEYAGTTWHGYIAVSLDASAPEPTFFSAPVNDPRDPLLRGTCGAVRCGEIGDFIDVRIAPDGSVWAPFVDACEGACARDADAPNSEGVGVAGRLWGGPSLWDEG